MQSDDATEPLYLQELRQSLAEWAAISSQMIDLLHETAGSERSRNWRPHFTQIVMAVQTFGDRCRSEAEAFGLWRVDGLEADDVFERIREQGQRLVDWLQRMMAE
ncbi:MAG TPA: hypothetical protein VK993_08105 [Chthoniobacterales bacterium]|nr:hypothetical protein [Chthoniobacterales bacterium]